MKRVLSLMLAVVLVFGLARLPVSAAPVLSAGTGTPFSANVAGTPSTYSFATAGVATLTPGQTYTIPLGASAFNTPANDITQADLLNASATPAFINAGVADQQTLGSVFSGITFTLENPGAANARVLAHLTVSQEIATARNFSIPIKLAITNTEGVVTSATPLQYLTGNVAANPNLMTGFQTNISPAPASIKQGESFRMALANSHFTFVGTPAQALTYATLNGTYGITASTSAAGFTASIEPNTTNLLITAAANAAVGSTTVQVTLRGSKSAMNGETVTINFPVTVTVSNPDLMTGFKSNISPAASSVKQGESFRMALTNSHFTFAGTPTQALTYATLNGTYGITASTSASGFTASIEPNTTNLLVTASASAAVGSTTVPVTLQGSKSSMNGQTVTINLPVTVSASVPSTPPTITGVTAGASLQRTDGLGNNLAIGDVMTFLLPANFFQWSAGTGDKVVTYAMIQPYLKGINSADFDVSVSPGSSSVSRAASSSDGSAVLRLTAKRALFAANRSLYFQSGSVTSNTYNMNNLTVSNPVPVSGNKITGISSGAWLGNVVTRNDSALGSGETLDDLEVRPGDYIIFDFDSNFFEWKNGKPSPAVSVTESMLRNGKITARSTKRTGSDLINSVEVDSKNGKSFVRVKFAKDLAITSDRKFSLTVYLSVDGRRHTESEVTLSGTVSNELIELFEGDDYVDLSEGQIAKANAYLKDIQIYAGHNISFHTKMYNGRKYAAKVTSDLTSADEKMLNKYDNIVAIYNVVQVNLSSASTKTSFDMDEKLYVYNEQGDYLGTTKDKVKFSSKYYLTDKKVSLKTPSSSSSQDPNVEESSSSSTASGNGNSSSSGSGSSSGSSGNGSGSSNPGSESATNNPNLNPSNGRVVR
ncbi:hypothetical protein U6B65_01025 [Oscillospiraceae bacterium MB08-C2-2]|nr:hypothetical protein U6B65_01025 [Oscillospiraceae bacterium MB08-C2-2]